MYVTNPMVYSNLKQFAKGIYLIFNSCKRSPVLHFLQGFFLCPTLIQSYVELIQNSTIFYGDLSLRRKFSKLWKALQRTVPTINISGRNQNECKSKLINLPSNCLFWDLWESSWSFLAVRILSNELTTLLSWDSLYPRQLKINCA